MSVSMTGFGRGESQNENYEFVVEVRSINHKYLDMNIKMPKTMSFLEENIRLLIKESLTRGRIDISVKLQTMGKNPVDLVFDEDLATKYFNILSEIRQKFSAKDDISVTEIAKYPCVINVEEKEQDEEEIWKTLVQAVEKAILGLIQMRCKEGKKLTEDIISRAEKLDLLIKEVEKHSLNLIDDYKDRLNQRIGELLMEVELDQSRLAQEVAIYADKVGIDEEIVRFKSHIKQLKDTVIKNEPVGRKMDFIVQEMNREVNTIGSKSTKLEITNLVVELKTVIEKIREQIQNIE